MRVIKSSVLFVVTAAVMILFSAFSIQPSTPTSDELKSAFLYNFARFVQWPEKPHSETNIEPFRIGVIGHDALGQSLEALAGDQTIDGRQIEVHLLSAEEPADWCDLIYISSSENTRLPTILQQLRGKPALTVGETDRFLRLGGVIRFVESGNRIRFEINLHAAHKAGLGIDAKLLRVARAVYGREGEVAP